MVLMECQKPVSLSTSTNWMNGNQERISDLSTMIFQFDVPKVTEFEVENVEW
jgi:hypothetical protein